MRDLYIKNGQGFVVVYSLTNHQTFQDIKTMRDQIVRVKGSDRVPILLVGNKVDLERSRQVATTEGKELARCYDAKFIETSAGLKHNVDELLVGVLKQIMLRNQQGAGKLQVKVIYLYLEVSTSIHL